MSSQHTPNELLVIVQNAYDKRIGGKGQDVSSELFASILESESSRRDVKSAIYTVALLSTQAKNESEENLAHRKFALLVLKLTTKDKEFLSYLWSRMDDKYPVAVAICFAQRRRLGFVDDVEEEKWPSYRVQLGSKGLNQMFED